MGLTGTDWQEALLPHLDEAELAAWERARGRRVVELGGRHWAAIAPGFYQPLHVLARFRANEIRRPQPLAWGWRAVLDPADRVLANASLPVHVLPDLQGYSLERLQPRRRQQIRKALREVDVVALDDPSAVIDQGFALAMEAQARNPEVAVAGPAEFGRWVEAFMAPRRGLVLGCLRHNRLLALCFSYAVDGVNYEHMTYVGEAGLPHNLALCLFHLKVLIAQRTRGVTTIVNGLHARENPNLCEFKTRQGLVIEHVPTRLAIQPLAGLALRRWRPNQYYRLTGAA